MTGMTVFYHCRLRETDFREGGLFYPSALSVSSPKKVHLNRVKDTHFTCPLELEANDPLKLPVVQALNNPINTF